MHIRSPEYSLAELVDFPALEVLLRDFRIEPRSFDLLLDRPESRHSSASSRPEAAIFD